MINQFLATLDNNPVAPDAFIWPSFVAREVTGAEKAVRDTVLGANLSRQLLFSRCLQLVNLVAQSPLATYIVAQDPRLTYTEDSIRNRFQVAGTAVAYTGTNGSPPTIALVLTSTTPDVVSFSVDVTSPTTAVVTDDAGNTVTRTFSFSGGMTTPISARDGTAAFVLTGNAPAAGDSWVVAYQKAGASWVEQALVRVQTAPVKQIMTPDVLAWYNNSQLTLDKLAAVVTALATQ